MTFATGYLGDPEQVGAGESYSLGIDLGSDTFEDGLIIGRFAKLDSGSIDNMDNSATPVLAGVVLKRDSNAIESGSTFDSAIQGQISYRRTGLVTIDLKAGETPAAFTRVYANNDATANAGLGMAASGGANIATSAEWIEEIQTDVWLINLGAY